MVELLVRLVVPDNVAITTFHTLERLGFELDELKREDYYSFEVEENADQFMKDIGNVDILVNANKHRFTVKKKDEPFGDGVRILVKNKENDTAALLSILQRRLGFKNIKKIEQGVLWTIKPADKKLAKKIAKELLVNEHYQEFTVL